MTREQRTRIGNEGFPTRIHGIPRQLAWTGSTHAPAELRLGGTSWMSSGWHRRLPQSSSLPDAEQHTFEAYLDHSLLGTVMLRANEDGPRMFHRFTRLAEAADADFRFVAAAPREITSANGENFLDAAATAARFVEPACSALGSKTGALLFCLSSFSTEMITQHRADPARFVDRLASFCAALPSLRSLGVPDAQYVIEFDNPTLLSRRVIGALKAAQVRYSLTLNASMPGVRRQSTALEFLDSDSATAGALRRGPLFVRWTQTLTHTTSTGAGNAPIADPETRNAIAALTVQTLQHGAHAYLLIDDAAEGDASQSLDLIGREIAAMLDADA